MPHREPSKPEKLIVVLCQKSSEEIPYNCKTYWTHSWVVLVAVESLGKAIKCTENLSSMSEYDCVAFRGRKTRKYV